MGTIHYETIYKFSTLNETFDLESFAEAFKIQKGACLQRLLGYEKSGFVVRVGEQMFRKTSKLPNYNPYLHGTYWLNEYKEPSIEQHNNPVVVQNGDDILAQLLEHPVVMEVYEKITAAKTAKAFSDEVRGVVENHLSQINKPEERTKYLSTVLEYLLALI